MSILNIDVSRLRSALYTCKNSINYSNSENLISSISDSNVWQTESQKKIKLAIGKLIDVRYKDLENLLDSYIGVTSQIEEYQMLKNENDNLDYQYSSLSNRLYYSQQESYIVLDEEGNETVQYRTITVKDYYVENQMNQNRYKYRENKEKMEVLKSSIDNSI